MKLLIILASLIQLSLCADLADKVFCTKGSTLCASKCCNTVYKSTSATKTAET